MNRSLKRLVNGIGLHISSLKSQEAKEFSQQAERDRLTNECERLAFELSHCARETERLVLEQTQLLHAQEEIVSGRDGLMDDIDDLFGLLLTSNGGGSRKAQINQDVLALALNGFKKDGFFVEFGATNGVDLSNTHILEKHFGWRGILAEPATVWQKDLAAARACHIETDCVWSRSGETLDFDIVREGEFSTISSFSTSDGHAIRREDKATFKVRTISLLDLLRKYSAPQNIDYISLDTEGSEYDILKEFDFSAYRFNVITVEHNYTSNRERLRDLLDLHGYQRILQHMSRWDDWYIPKLP